jgi:hypothetical protein
VGGRVASKAGAGRAAGGKSIRRRDEWTWFRRQRGTTLYSALFSVCVRAEDNGRQAAWDLLEKLK